GEVGAGKRSGSPHLTPALSAPWGGEGGWLVRDPAYGADLGEFAAQLFPRIAGVIGREELAVMAARDDEAGVCGMRREVPDRRIRLRRERQHLPAPPAVLRALDRAGVAGRTVAGRDEQRS